MTALDRQDLLVLSLGLDCLRRYAASEAARQGSTRAKVAAMQTMQMQIAAVRVKLTQMQIGDGGAS